jgi:hypothetical protein
VSYQTIQADAAFPTSTVVQPSLDPYTSALPPSFGKPDTDSPLLSIRVTTLLPSRSTVIGVIFGHILGDGSSGNLYLSHLSHFYEHGPEAVLEPSEYPSFFPHIDLPVYPPPAEVLAEYDSGQIRPREISEMMAGYGGAAEKYEAVTLTLRRAELRALHCMVSDRAGGSRLSEQDVLSGWWLSLLRRTGENVEKMVYTVNVGTAHPLPREAVRKDLTRCLVSRHGRDPPWLPTQPSHPIRQCRTDALLPPRSSHLKQRGTRADLRHGPTRAGQAA